MGQDIKAIRQANQNQQALQENKTELPIKEPLKELSTEQSIKVNQYVRTLAAVSEYAEKAVQELEGNEELLKGMSKAELLQAIQDKVSVAKMDLDTEVPGIEGIY